MNVTPIDSMSIVPIDMPERGLDEIGQRGQGFMQVIGDKVNDLNGSLNQADQVSRALAAGDDVPVHDVMIAMEHARLKLQFAVEVRNRVLDAYQNLTNMQL